MKLLDCNAFTEAAKHYIEASRALRAFGAHEARRALPTATLALKAAGFSQHDIVEMAEHLDEDLGDRSAKLFAQLCGRDPDHRPWANWR